MAASKRPMPAERDAVAAVGNFQRGWKVRVSSPTTRATRRA